MGEGKLTPAMVAAGAAVLRALAMRADGGHIVAAMYHAMQAERVEPLPEAAVDRALEHMLEKAAAQATLEEIAHDVYLDLLAMQPQATGRMVVVEERVPTMTVSEFADRTWLARLPYHDPYEDSPLENAAVRDAVIEAVERAAVPLPVLERDRDRDRVPTGPHDEGAVQTDRRRIVVLRLYV
ncbi:hypothetical protein [Oceaniradius stylonematis]|uniref:hypothetical protein n=1 Tax=Oceaniradius stylonematis TaxID=2184161 RepID=UPI003B5C9147